MRMPYVMISTVRKAQFQEWTGWKRNGVKEQKTETNANKNNRFTYRPFISSVGQSPRPHGCSVAPTIKPNKKPNTNEMSIPVPRVIKPLFCERWHHYYRPINEKTLCEKFRAIGTKWKLCIINKFEQCLSWTEMNVWNAKEESFVNFIEIHETQKREIESLCSVWYSERSAYLFHLNVLGSAKYQGFFCSHWRTRFSENVQMICQTIRTNKSKSVNPYKNDAVVTPKFGKSKIVFYSLVPSKKILGVE